MAEESFQNNTPFKLYMHQDVALLIVKKTGRKTRRMPEQIGANEFGKVVKWYLADCTLTLMRYTKHAPYRVCAISAKEEVKPDASTEPVTVTPGG